MSSRIWWWGAGATVLGAVVLTSTINSRTGWHAPSNDADQVLTLNQLVGFIFSVLVLVIGLLILLHATRQVLRNRARARRFAGRKLRQEP